MKGAERGTASEQDAAISVITCPSCGHGALERMPNDACVFFFECPACHELVRPKPGDCCVFCSYGSEPCPPRQAAGSA
jgi:hypothetical protein